MQRHRTVALLQSLVLWLLLVQPGTSFTRDHIATRLSTPSHYYIVLYGEDFAPHRVKGRGGLWTGVFDNLYNPTYLNSSGNEAIFEDDQGREKWLYRVTVGPNSIPTKPKSLELYYPVGGVLWSQISGFAYFPSDTGKGKWFFQRPFITTNSDYNKLWEHFSKPFHNLVYGTMARQMLIYDLRSEKDQTEFLDEITKPNGLRILDHVEELENWYENYVKGEKLKALQSLLHWNPDNQRRKLPLPLPGEYGLPSVSISRRALVKDALNRLTLEPQDRTRLASGLYEHEFPDEKLREMLAKANRSRWGGGCAVS
ncbi:hypothetical protein CP533_1460 [Ophiocordyceps camponoti-saundersi (nom. inval.)]|nr:hypothetical protein CP533_1460 [Ophiocordyceps camponoti-saundersi (nom. inval.)]